MWVRIRTVPPDPELEGVDLRPFDFHRGHVYDLPQRLATILIVSGYAEPEMRRDDRDHAANGQRRSRRDD